MVYKQRSNLNQETPVSSPDFKSIVEPPGFPPYETSWANSRKHSESFQQTGELFNQAPAFTNPRSAWSSLSTSWVQTSCLSRSWLSSSVLDPGLSKNLILIASKDANDAVISKNHNQSFAATLSRGHPKPVTKETWRPMAISVNPCEFSGIRYMQRLGVYVTEVEISKFLQDFGQSRLLSRPPSSLNSREEFLRPVCINRVFEGEITLRGWAVEMLITFNLDKLEITGDIFLEAILNSDPLTLPLPITEINFGNLKRFRHLCKRKTLQLKRPYCG
ncbi:hypothetical protein Tco_0404976 [Tanacetum coccineum]